MAQSGDRPPQLKWHMGAKHHTLSSDLTEVFGKLEMGVIRTDPSFIITYANPSARGILSVSGEDIAGLRLQDLLPDSVASQLDGAARSALEEDAVRHFDACFPGRTILWAHFRCIPVREGLTVFLEDVTELKQAQESLRKTNEELEARVLERTRHLRQTGRRLEEQKELLLTIIDNIPVMLTFYDPAGAIKLVNKAFEDLAGWSLEEARSINLIAACYPDASYRKEVWEHMMKANPGWKDLELTTRSGRILPSSWAYVRLSDGSLIGIGIDISERRKEALFQQHLLQAQKMEALGNLAGGIAQNLKNAFTPILIDTEMLMADLGRSNPHYPMLEEMMHAIHHGIDLVKHLLTFSRRTPQLMSPVDAVPLVVEVMNFLRASLPSTIEISFSCSVVQAVVMADATQIKQVLVNLGSNAGHFMRRKGGTLAVDLAGVELDGKAAPLVSPDLGPGPYVRIMVSDTGEGMSHEDLEHIFEPFYTSKAGGEGAGLSLSVVHGIVKNHGGAVTAESTPGSGAVFTVYLPLKAGLPQ
jgi:PAS domain S-box-containing protein